jgi:hypothetical protein
MEAKGIEVTDTELKRLNSSFTKAFRILELALKK